MSLRRARVAWASGTVTAALLLAAPLASAQTSRPAATTEPAPAGTIPPPAADPVFVAVGGHLGGAYRADEPAAFEATDHGGLVIGASVLVWVRTWIGVGLTYEHTDLGHEQSGVLPTGLVEIDRDLSTLWASLRVAPVATEFLALYLAFGPGFSWQSADATGLAYTGPFAAAPVTFSCEGSDSLGLALRGGVGLEGRFRVPGLVLYAEATADAHRLSSEPLGNCVGGAGTATVLGARAGAAFRFDVARFVR